MESESKSSDNPAKGKDKKRTRTYLIVGAVLVVVIVIVAIMLGGLGGSAPGYAFSLTEHDAFAGANDSEGFYVTVSFTVNNTGTEAGNVTVIFKVFTDQDNWGGAQTFNIPPGEARHHAKDNIYVEGDPDSAWYYQCFIQGEKAVNYPHS